jgi:hypothetical protein
MEITGEETKVMAFRGPETIRSNMCINEGNLGKLIVAMYPVKGKGIVN